MVIRMQPHFFVWDREFPDTVVAGYSGPSLTGDVTAEMPGLLASCGVDADAAYMKQVHGGEIRSIDTPGRYECDGIFTASPRLTLVVRTADCLPLVFYSAKERVAGVVHMGWRSAEAGILEHIAFALSSFSCIAGVGMRRCCYVVGEDFVSKTRLKDFVERRGEAYYFDPVAFARTCLIQRGLPEERFIDTGICSCCSQENHHSYRKTATDKRTLSFIVMK